MSKIEAWECNGIIMVREGNPLAVLAEGQKVDDCWRKLAVASPAPAPIEREAVDVIATVGGSEVERFLSWHPEKSAFRFEVGTEVMTVAQHERIVAAKDTRIAELEAAQIEVINSRNAHQWEYERVSEELAAKDAEIARLQRNFAVEQQIANNWEAKTNELRAQLAAQQAAVPDECPHLIMFDDTDVKPIMFAGCGARTAALAKFEQISGQWNAHLFIRIARNCRDDLYPCATLAAPAAQHHGELEQLRAERDRLIALVDSPELHDFAKGVTLEAAHQRNRWGSEHDAGKEPQDWFWLVGYLAGKALRAHAVGDTEKALHHTISTAAALNNWHASITGADTSMRPGVDPARLNPSAQGEKP